MSAQKDEILDQFTKQAKGFARANSIKDKKTLDLLLDFTKVQKEDTVLDIACGPGIVTCAYAQKAKHATGIDIVPAMIDEAKTLQKDYGLSNVSWNVGDVTTLPYQDNSFSIVICRYSFHHFENPLDV